jgi:hypothetical protein
MADVDDLFSQFTNLDEIAPEEVLLNRHTGAIHRLDDTAMPSCGYDPASLCRADWDDVSHGRGTRLCRNCWSSILHWEAEKPDSPVVRVGPAVGDGGEAPEYDEYEPQPPGRTTPALDALPTEVVITSGGEVYHAPGVRGESLCFQVGDTRRKELKFVRDWRRPCRDCFSERVVEAEAERG